MSMTCDHLCHDSFICVARRDMTQSYMCCRHIRRLTYERTMTHPSVWHIVFARVSRTHRQGSVISCVSVPWRIHMCAMTYLHVCRKLTYSTAPRRPTSLWYVCHSLICVSLFDMCVTHSSFVPWVMCVLQNSPTGQRHLVCRHRAWSEWRQWYLHCRWRPLSSWPLPAVCCSVLQCVAVCWSVLQWVGVCCNGLECIGVCCSVA